MLNASGYGSSFTRSEVEIKCHHQIDSKLRMVINGSNLGKKLYGCSLWPVSGFCLICVHFNTITFNLN